MTNEDKNLLLESLDKTLEKTHKLLKGVNQEAIIYKDPEWRVKDIIGHLSTWNRETAKSLMAFLAGKDYSIPDLGEEEDDFNEQEVVNKQEWTIKKILEELEQTITDLKNIVQEIPIEKYPGDLLYPWGGERGNISDLIKFIIDHDNQHREDIVKALQD